MNVVSSPDFAQDLYQCSNTKPLIIFYVFTVRTYLSPRHSIQTVVAAV